MKVLKYMVRVYVHNLDEAIKFYEKIAGAKCQHRFSYHEASLELATVENFLIICGSEEVLAPFRKTDATLLVDSLVEYQEFLELNGAVILKKPQAVPTGLNMTVKHADGLIIEYVEHT